MTDSYLSETIKTLLIQTAPVLKFELIEIRDFPFSNILKS
jgi:hypothetical protein